MNLSFAAQKKIALSYSKQLVNATIAAGQSSTPGVDLGDQAVLGLTVGVGSQWTDAAIGVSVSEDGSTWDPVRDETGARVKITGVQTDARGVYIWDRDLWAIKNYRYIRLDSINSSTGAAVNQIQARTLRIGILS